MATSTTTVVQHEITPLTLVRESVVPVPTLTTDQMLAEIRMRCNQMHEAKDMCLHLFSRLEDTIRELESLDPAPSSETYSMYTSILKRYLDFLSQQPTRGPVFRLVVNRVVVRRNFEFHEQINNLLESLNLKVSPDWKLKWATFRDAQQKAFQTMSKMTLLNNLRDVQTQTEALSLLMFEYHKVNSKYTESELLVLNSAFDKISQFSKAKTPPLANWFLPIHEVDREADYFARGAFAKVYHGSLFGAHVVVKCVDIHSEQARAQFVIEANAWYHASNNPNVVHLYGACHLGQTPFFVCEYAANGTLRDYLFQKKNRKYTWKTLLDAAHGLQFLHSRMIIHNDLKCNNILVSADGVAKITDFGLSKLFDASRVLSVMQNVGAVSWKAPELLQKEPSPPSFQSDIYSFGMCIYEAASGSIPWEGLQPSAVSYNVRKGNLPKRPDTFTDDQWSLIQAMCARNPEDRPEISIVVNKLHELSIEEANREDEEEKPSAQTGATSALAGEDVTSHEPVPEPSSEQETSQPTPASPPTSSADRFVESAEITGHRIVTVGRKEVVEYKLELTMSNHEMIVCWKRYSSFRNFRKRLVQYSRSEMAGFPAFPRRTFWFRRSTSDATIKDREDKLSKFVMAVAQSNELPLDVRLDDTQSVFKTGRRPNFLL
ncbi:Tkl protein kinase, partial [Globisporangium splendens]